VTHPELNETIGDASFAKMRVAKATERMEATGLTTNVLQDLVKRAPQNIRLTQRTTALALEDVHDPGLASATQRQVNCEGRSRGCRFSSSEFAVRLSPRSMHVSR